MSNIFGEPNTARMMRALELGIPTHTELDLPQADNIKINDMGPVMRAAGNGDLIL